jgi:putative OPT family oligopeptide transporter
MALFQQAPRTVEEAEQYKPLDISPDQVLKMDEAEWYDKIYRGDDVPQLTLRATLMGSFLGFLLAFTNLYIGLKTGWALGVAITACILSYSIWNFFLKAGVAKSPMTILENNCMQSTASAAGYSTGGTMVSAIAALLILSATPDNPQGEHMDIIILICWTMFLAAFGTVLAIPMKRNLINREKLKFPSGTAAATTLQSLYSEGVEALKKAKALTIAAAGGAIFPLLIELKVKAGEALMAAEWHIFDKIPAPGGTHLVAGKEVPYKSSDWTMVWDVNPVMIAAGALVGLRIAIYMMIGGLALVYGLGDMGMNAEWVNADGEVVQAVSKPWKAWKEIGLWTGVPIMLSYGLLQFATQWRTIVRAFSGLGKKTEVADHQAKLVAATEVPNSWFATGFCISGAAIIITANAFFDIPMHFGLLAVVLTFFLALVAARATGESDITPVGAMGKIMQLTFGTFIPSGTANLMSASITANGAGCAADLLTDLKSGYLLGANPRRQFIAQMMGILAGTAATVTGFRLLVPDATALTGVDLADGTHIAPDFPAPAAQAWKAVADVMTGGGIDAMHPMHLTAIYWGLALGALFLILEMTLPKMKAYLPSATGIGLGLILPFQYPLSMCVGAIIAWYWTKRNKEHAESYLVPVAAGLIAGISIMGVLVAILNTIMAS